MFKFIKKIHKTFKKLKEIFIKTSILFHFDFKRRIRLKIDVFDFAISEIIFQLIKKIDQWHFCGFTPIRDTRRGLSEHVSAWIDDEWWLNS
jgi:hypothetical protein